MALLSLPLLFIFFGARAVDACMPMQPGELPCPSSPPQMAVLPLNTTTTKYYELPKTPITGATGEKVYKCKYNMVDSENEDRIAPSREFVCVPDSGRFMLVESGKEIPIPPGVTYACSEKACPAVLLTLEDTTTQVAAPFSWEGVIMEQHREDDIIASCPSGSALYVTSGPEPELVEPDNIPTCKRNSGKWDMDYKEEYQCLKKACKEVQLADDNIKYCPVAQTLCDFEQVDTNSEEDFTCKEPYTVRYLESGDVGTPESTNKLTCKTASGKWESEEGDLVEDAQVTCGRDRMCQSCPQPTLINDEASLCSWTDTFCTKQPPVIKVDAATQCNEIICEDAASTVSIVMDDKTVRPLTNSPYCSLGKWKLADSDGGGEVNVQTAIACTKRYNCDICKKIVENEYRDQEGESDSYEMAVKDVQMENSCLFTCTKNPLTEFNLLTVSDKTLHESVTCDIITGVAQFTGGDALSNWACYRCGTCDVNWNHPCRPGYVCYSGARENCLFESPEGTITLYKGGKFPFPDWKSGLQCAQPRSDYATAYPPPNSGCVALTKPAAPYKDSASNDIPEADARFGELRYQTIENNVVIAFCATGTLYTPNAAFRNSPELKCMDNKWPDAAATCLIPKYDGDTCVAAFMNSAGVRAECKNGGCRVFCDNGKNIKFEIAGTPTTAVAAYCAYDRLTTENNLRVQNAVCETDLGEA